MESNKCDMNEQTTDDALEFIKSDDQIGIGVFLYKNEEGASEKFKKIIYQDISYGETKEIGKTSPYFKFLPYGLKDSIDALRVDLESGKRIVYPEVGEIEK